MSDKMDIKIPTKNRENNFWFGTKYDTEEMEWAGKCESGMMIPKSLKIIMNDVSVMSVLSDAVAAAGERGDIAGNVLLRIYNQERKTAVIEAVKYELVNRLNWRVANGNPHNERPRPPLDYLVNSMRNARRHAAQLAQQMEAVADE